MIENLSAYIIWSFALVTILTVIFYLHAVLKTGQKTFFG